MPATIRTALLFLIETLFNLYLFLLVIRIIFVWVRVDYFNPVTQFVARMTDRVIRPIRKLFPNINHFETASMILILGIESVKFFLIIYLNGNIPNLTALPLLALADTLAFFIQVFTYAILLQALLSFVQPMSPLMSLLLKFNSPIMRPIQRLIPPIGGFDLSPIPALLGLQLLSILLVGPLSSAGQGMVLG